MTLFAQNFPHEPTLEQWKAFSECARFMVAPLDDCVFLLRGYAGTGKTSLVGAMVETLVRLGQRVELLAPTGRSAKVMESYARHPAYTIHRRIYRQRSMVHLNEFEKGVNLTAHTLFIVDEASMISNQGGNGPEKFGSGRLLDDLMEYVYSKEGCRLMLIGDTAQLPPVGESVTPALNARWMATYGLRIYKAQLTEVVRQTRQSGILWNATMLRQMMLRQQWSEMPLLKVKGFPDVTVVPGSELIETLEESYRRQGLDQTIVVTRSNKTAHIYNQGIRHQILGYESELSGGDRLMVARNDYYWLPKNFPPTQEAPSAAGSRKPGESIPFIANGDTAVVRYFRNEREFYGFRFADVILQFPDYDDLELQVTALLDTLHAQAPALTREQQQELFQGVWEDYPEIGDKRKRMKRLREDIYFNALQVKYAYAVTCHKAQGGQWEHVYIDQGYITDEMMGPDYFRWLYTALTRATRHVFLVNWKQVE